MSAVRTFRSSQFGTPGVAPLSLGVPAASYPGAIASNAQLVIAVDRLQANLAAPLAATDTQMTVQNGAGIVASCLLSIDSEIVQVQSGSGSIWQISRGFDGTIAALHLAGALVSGFVDAWHHNALVSEVQAIENTLGTNLSRIPSSPTIPVAQYNFTPMAPGGTLSPGSQVITLAPVPRGVNGTDQNHYLYISGGTGAAEAVLITGGTAVSGAPSGTVICTIGPGGHSGPWTLQSASAGITEAIVVNGNAAYVLPAGNVLLYAPVTITDTNISLRGLGQGVTILRTAGGLTGDWLYFKTVGGANYIDLGSFTIVDNTSTAHTAGSMIRLNKKSIGQVSNLEIENGWDGIVYDTCPGAINSFGLHIGCARHAIYITTFGVNYPSVPLSSGVFSNCFLASTTSNAACIQVEGPTTTIYFANVSALCVPVTASNACVEWDTTSANPSGESIFSGCILDSAGRGVVITADAVAYGSMPFLIFEGCEINATEAGLYITGNVQNVYWNGGLIKASGGTANQPVLIGGSGIPKNIQIRNVSIYGTGTWAFDLNSTLNIQIQNVAVGIEGSGPTTFMRTANAVSAVIENCNMAACTAGKIVRLGGAPFANVRVTDFSNAWAFADLQAFANGSIIMCADGTTANPVAGGGTGCLAKRLNGAWVGN